MNEFGKWVVERILEFAAWLTGEDTPGLVSAGLLAALALLSILYVASAWRFRRAVKVCRSILPETNGRITGERLIEIDRRFADIKNKDPNKKKGPRHRLGVAWEEFRETTVEPENETDQLRNTVRPTVFFARDELGLDRGAWRQIPALFVSIGLFLTFLGLVAALDQTSEILDAATTGENGATTDGLKTLLRIAGAKFIMSLTGLLCSIAFTLVLRYAARWVDGHSMVFAKIRRTVVFSKASRCSLAVCCAKPRSKLTT